MPLIGSDSPHGLSKEENRILALQNINRLNQTIGQLVRSGQSSPIDMKVLQTQVNNLTIGVKYDNAAQMKIALTQVRNLVTTYNSMKSKN